MHSVFKWIEGKIGSTFQSPRESVFGTRTIDFKIVRIDDEKVSIKFKGSKYLALPLKKWMFERVLAHLHENEGKFVLIGARIGPPYIPTSVEGAIWETPVPQNLAKYKVAPHICDILALAGVVEFGTAYKPNSSRKLQGVRARKT